MEHAIIEIFKSLAAAGPIGALVAAGVIAGVAGIVLFARSKQLFDNAAADARLAAFQKDLLEQLRLVTSREEKQREAVDQLQAEVYLLRVQMHKLIILLTNVRDGRIAPADIEIPGQPT